MATGSREITVLAVLFGFLPVGVVVSPEGFEPSTY
jgi:hypothetical protein